MNRCPRKKDPEAFCPACDKADRIIRTIDEIMSIRQDELPQDRWYWMCVRFSRHWRTKLRELVARKRAELVEKWQPIPEENRFRPVRILTGGYQCGCASGSGDLDATGSYGPALRAYEDRYDDW